MPDAPDMTNPILDDWAKHLYAMTPRCADLGLSPDLAEAWRVNVWERAPAELRDLFRARAVRLRQGDTSMLPLMALGAFWPVP